MLTAESVHAEGARYAASLVCIPGLWAGPPAWRGFATYLGHRGWESHLLDLRAVPGGVEGRAAAVAGFVGELQAPPILVGHDAGGIVALAAAARITTAGVVLVAPLAPGSRGARTLVRAPRRLLALIRGGPVLPPAGAAAAAWLDLPDPARSATAAGLAADDAASVRDVVWGRTVVARATGVPVAVVAGDRDTVLPRPAAAALAQAAGAELVELPGGGHWLLAGPTWQPAVALVHRWLVRRLGAPLLELYEEAMAEREADDDDVD
jgi:pimeloyl-ACP methyl ester carboxylesterase